MFYGPSNFYDDGIRLELERAGKLIPKPRAAKLPISIINPQADTKLLIHVEQMPETIEGAILTLREVTPKDATKSLKAILQTVALTLGYTIEEMTGPSRRHRYSKARMVYYWLAREMTTASLPMIGRHCGGRDHTTIMSGLKTVERLWKDFEPIITNIKRAL